MTTTPDDIIDDVQTNRSDGELIIEVVIDDDAALEHAKRDAAELGEDDHESIAADNVQRAVLQRVTEVDGAFDPDVPTTTFVVTELDTDMPRADAPADHD